MLFCKGFALLLHNSHVRSGCILLTRVVMSYASMIKFEFSSFLLLLRTLYSAPSLCSAPRPQTNSPLILSSRAMGPCLPLCSRPACSEQHGPKYTSISQDTRPIRQTATAQPLQGGGLYFNLHTKARKLPLGLKITLSMATCPGWAIFRVATTSLTPKAGSTRGSWTQGIGTLCLEVSG